MNPVRSEPAPYHVPLSSIRCCCTQNSVGTASCAWLSRIPLLLLGSATANASGRPGHAAKSVARTTDALPESLPCVFRLPWADSHRSFRRPAEYFLAQGGTSCDEACAAKGTTCDADALHRAGSSVGTCKKIIESLGKTPQRGGQYSQDNSGCTYHPRQTGWYQVMRKDDDPACGEVNPDSSRQRVCACHPPDTGGARPPQPKAARPLLRQPPPPAPLIPRPCANPPSPGLPQGVHLDVPGQRRGQQPSSVWTVDSTRGSETGTVRGLRWHKLPREGKGEWARVRIGQAEGEGGHWGGERLMGAAAGGGSGSKG